VQVDQVNPSGIVERYIVCQNIRFNMSVCAGQCKNVPKRAPKWVQAVNEIAWKWMLVAARRCAGKAVATS